MRPVAEEGLEDAQPDGVEEQIGVGHGRTLSHVITMTLGGVVRATGQGDRSGRPVRAIGARRGAVLMQAP